MGFPRRHTLAFGCLMVLASTSGTAQTVTPPARQYDLPSQELKYALRAVTRPAGLELYAETTDLRGRKSPEIRGTFTAEQALAQLLAGSGLEADIEGRAVFIRGRSASTGDTGDTAGTATAEIVVTGSHIRGAQIASPTITMSAESIRDAGQTSIGDAVRDLPQNFSGGQNPGVVGEGDQRGQNLNSSSTIDLRGLGPDATLTLINGHRVAYTGEIQGVDIDQIPLAALDGIEIVADGASAIYGSDAVGGVANILLKRDYQGATLSARLGATTGGGDEQQQYDLTTGSRWASGGFMVAASVRRNTNIVGTQRSVTEDLGRDMTVLPWIHQYGAVLSGHQDLADRLHFEVDGSYNHRTTANQFPSSDAHVVTTDGSVSAVHESTYSISPRFTFDVSDRWHTSLSTTYGGDNTAGVVQSYSGSAAYYLGHYGYRNRTVIAEVSADGPLFALPGGSAQLAVGGGYRRNHLVVSNRASYFGVDQAPTRLPAHQQSYYGYAELNFPLVSPENHWWRVHSLSASAAVRYEDYPGLDHLATPKLGLVYAPFDDLTLKASWGRSFKTPTLYQLHQLESAVVIASDFVGAGAPAGSNSIFLSGGNPNLKPERATTWSTTAAWHPHQLRGFEAEFSYFHIDYRNRVADPIESLSGLFLNPIYQDLINRDPSAELLAAIPEEAGAGFSNFTGAPYDPSTVFAVIDDRNLNSAREQIHGFDVDLNYQSKIGSDGSIAIHGAVSHLVSERKLSPLQPSIDLAGTIFNPPHWRGHASITWRDGPLTLTTDLTYIGGVTDNRNAVAYHVRGMAPVDLAAGYHLSLGHAPIKALDLLLAVRNVQDVKPARIANTNLYDPTYDSNNYSAIGRQINLTVSASF